MQWVVEAYALFLAALLLAGGSLGDHFGRKRIYTVGVVLFALASIWCGPGGQLLVFLKTQNFKMPQRQEVQSSTFRLLGAKAHKLKLEL